MKGPSPKTLIAVLSFAAVISAAVVDFGKTAPGELTAAHGRIEGLAGDKSCSECHGGWTSSMTSSCLVCHELIEVHMENDLGLHGMLDATVAENCAACHSEHHGASFMAVNDLSFARAGVQDPEQFEHRLVGFLMEGAHMELDCSQCHEHAEAQPVPEGAHRFLGLRQACVSCHEDVHEGRYQTSCVDCHDQHTFEAQRFVDHSTFLELEGGHAGLSCAECHAEGSTHSIAALRGPESARPEHRSCAVCHDVPHSESFVLNAAATSGVARAATLRGVPANQLCANCHASEHLSFAEDAEALSPALHAASGFPLAAPHDVQDCAQCHEPALAYGERYPGRDADTCAACHDDVHGGQFQGLAFAPVSADSTQSLVAFLGGSVDEQGCLACHARTHFEPHTFGVEAHASTDLPLTGAHLESECAACHGPAEELGGAARFHGVAHRCEACHADAHRGFFDEVLAAEPAGPDEPLALKHGDCARCHDTNSFGTAHRIGTDAEFDHERWTGYALTGAHGVAECTSCHTPRENPDETGRLFGAVADLYGEVKGCASCHDDVHEGQFDRRRLPASIDGRSDCARCHTTASFRDQPHGFDHGRWTGWPLADAHAATECSSCHEPMRRPDEIGRTWRRAAGTGCASCHESPHGDQFEAPRPKDCVKCHESALAFSVLSFDHDLESRFPLDEAHEAVACADCHKPEPQTAPNQPDLVRYRPLSTECVDCHGVHEKALRRRKQKR
ncbi:Class III cytochrome C family protein [Planctomycetes bacterium Poly30]|uniref:Class III cytochrome C family protein n=1 Tax=Saltatorellus ferox TaxID=2528018 RepID=A0A518ENW4_9BACT|nr:Class III cytochrome C family protein [Planctomycetes bacterium Poly30]